MMRGRNLQKLAILVAACGWLARTSAYAQDQQSSEPPKPPAKPTVLWASIISRNRTNLRTPISPILGR
jgi:hypothetical protein